MYLIATNLWFRNYFYLFMMSNYYLFRYQNLEFLKVCVLSRFYYYKKIGNSMQERTTYKYNLMHSYSSNMEQTKKENRNLTGILGRDRVATLPCAMHLNCLINVQPTATCDLRSSAVLCPNLQLCVIHFMLNKFNFFHAFLFCF